MAGYHRLASAQKKLGKNAEAIATLKAAQSAAPDADKVPAIKKLLRDLNQEAGKAAAPVAAGGRQLPPSVAKELQELQPQFLSIQREVEQVRQSIRLCVGVYVMVCLKCLQYGQIDSKLGAYGRQKKRVALVEKELNELPEGTKTYQSIGLFTKPHFFLGEQHEIANHVVMHAHRQDVPDVGKERKWRDAQGRGEEGGRPDLVAGGMSWCYRCWKVSLLMDDVDECRRVRTT